jgi:hypothetical protein
MESRHHHSQIPSDRSLQGEHGDATLRDAIENRLDVVTLSDNSFS